MLDPRPIKSDLKTRYINPEKEKPSRWSFLKILREYSTLKQFYPEINPYAEVYKFRDNVYCIYYDGIHAAEMWCYLIDGPEKALLIDTAFGLGDLKGLIHKLVGDKEVIVCNTHRHIDHVSGNSHFEKVYCHYADAQAIKDNQSAQVVYDFVHDENGELSYTWFDENDLPPFSPYEVIGVDNHHLFDLGQGYIVELIHLPGHTAGQSGFLDHQNGCFFIGDVTSAFGGDEKELYPEFCTINSLRDALKDFMPRIEEVSGVFPGHGTIDLHPKTLQYIMDTANRIIAHPDWYDTKVDFFGTEMYAKFIYQQGSDLKYTKEAVIKE